jgi:hypothetical protein
MKPKKVKPTRWQRLHAWMKRNGWSTSLDQAGAIGSVTISKVRSEMRDHGIVLQARRREGTTLTEYRVARAR